MGSKNIDFLQDCAILIDGIYVTDLMSGNPYKVAYNTDRINPLVGADGTTAVAETNDNSANMSINVKQTSPTNSVLSKYANQKKTFSVAFEDSNQYGRVRASGSDCRVIKYAEITRGAEVTGREWGIYIPSLKIEE